MNSTQAGDSGLSEFVVRLIDDTFKGLMTSASNQTARLAEIDALLTLPEKEFQTTQITDVLITERLVALFGPAKLSGHDSAVDAGEPYRRAGKLKKEDPAILRETGVKLGEGDVSKAGGNYQFSDAGCKRVRAAIATYLAKQAIARLTSVRKHGLTRVVVEKGKINVKLAMKLMAQQTAAGEVTSPIIGIHVTPLSLSNPANLRSKTKLSAELEIHFKTSPLEK